MVTLVPARNPRLRSAAGRSRHAERADAIVTSIFERTMGEEFRRLHPMLRRRFGSGLEPGCVCIGRGVMHRIHVRAPWTGALLRLGGTRDFLPTRPGRNVPFEIRTFPRLDPRGRAVVTSVRRFDYPGGVERFETTTVAAPTGIVDHLGAQQRLAIDLAPRATPDGGLTIRSGRQRLSLGPVRLPLRPSLTGLGLLRERFDEEAECFRITMGLRHPQLGVLFGYDGSFTCEYLDADEVPEESTPLPHERRG